MIDTGAVRQNLVTLCCVSSYKGKKETPKMPSTKKKKSQKEQYASSPNKANKKAKNILLFIPST